jgi:peroxiredoxin (alkyl hydroperoxide reductase subunit C)
MDDGPNKHPVKKDSFRLSFLFLMSYNKRGFSPQSRKGDKMAEQVQGCARVTGTVVGEKPGDQAASPHPIEIKEMTMTARVGQKAPDFTAPSYYKGSFTPVKLSDFAGKWVLVCFYPGDFTFV